MTPESDATASRRLKDDMFRIHGASQAFGYGRGNSGQSGGGIFGPIGQSQGDEGWTCGRAIIGILPAFQLAQSDPGPGWPRLQRLGAGLRQRLTEMFSLGRQVWMSSIAAPGRTPSPAS